VWFAGLHGDARRDHSHIPSLMEYTSCESPLTYHERPTSLSVQTISASCIPVYDIRRICASQQRSTQQYSQYGCSWRHGKTCEATASR